MVDPLCECATVRVCVCSEKEREGDAPRSGHQILQSPELKAAKGKPCPEDTEDKEGGSKGKAVSKRECQSMLPELTVTKLADVDRDCS